MVWINNGDTGLSVRTKLNTIPNDGTNCTAIASGGALGTPLSGTLTNCTGLPAAGVVGTAAILGANTFTDTQTITQGTANHSLLASTGGSNTGSNATSALDLSWTLNTTGSPDVIALRVTDTARGASTKLLNIYAGASGTTSVFSVTRVGGLVLSDVLSGATSIVTTAGGNFSFSGKGFLLSQSDGYWYMTNSGVNTWDRLAFGGTSSSFPAVQRNGPALQFVLADASAACDLVQGNAALATSATSGFIWIESCAGTPTGTPTTYTGRVPIIFDTTNSQFWIYTGGAWKQPKTPAAAATVTWQ